MNDSVNSKGNFKNSRQQISSDGNGGSGRQKLPPNIFNYEDSSRESIERLPSNIHANSRFYVNDKFQAAERFLEDYHTDVTIRDPGTKGFIKKHAYLYKDSVTILEQKKIKIIDINYDHFTDWISHYHNKVSKICEKYQFDSTFVDLDKIDQYELNDLCIFMYSKHLLNCVEGDAFEEFQSVFKKAALNLFKEEIDQDFEPELMAEYNPDIERTRILNELHIGLINFPEEKEITDIRAALQNKIVCIKGDLDSYDDSTRYEILTSLWECSACGFKCRTYKSTPPSKCPNEECGEKRAFRDLEKYTGTEYVYMKLSQHVQAEETLIGTSEIIVKVEGPHLISNLWKRTRQSATLKVTGIVKVSQERLNRNNIDERKHFIQAVSIEVEGEAATVQYNDKLLDIIANKVKPKFINKHYEKIQRSICPHLHELMYVKEAIMLMLAGAVARLDSSTKRRLRGDLVIMLLGDPSLGKSEFGIFICKVNPYAIRTIGGSKTTTAAALTSSFEIIKDVKVISKGVLPRCDMKGIAIIDELDKRNSEDMQVLAIPLDDNQVIPTHKSNYHHDIPARCPVLLIGNASKNHGRWDTTKNIAAQTNYGSWLVSRADLIFILTDDGDLKRKEQQVEHMAKSRATMMSEGDYNKSHKNRVYTDLQLEKIEKDLENDNYDGIYDTEYLRHEFHYLKQTYKPYIVPGSPVEDLLKKEYLRFSQITMVQDDGDGSPYSQSIMDARAYNGLERIAMSVARVRRHHRVTMEDMQQAVNLMLASVTTMLLKPRNDVDKLNDGNMSLHKQFLKLFKEKDGFNKMMEAENSAWGLELKRQKKIFATQIGHWNIALERTGFDKCKSCDGRGEIGIDAAEGWKTEKCFDCSGKGYERKDFTFTDFEFAIKKLKAVEDWKIKPWFDYYKQRGMIIHGQTRNVYKMGIEKPDRILMNDLCNELAERFALEKLEAKRQEVEQNLGSI